MAAEGDLVGDALALAANDSGEVDAAGVLDEDVEAGFRGGDLDGEMALVETAVEGSYEFFVDVNACVVVEAVENEVEAAGAGGKGAIEDVAVGLVEVLHGEQMIGDAPGQEGCARVRRFE